MARSPDIARMARAFAHEGADLRHWVSYGTVATLNGEEGSLNYGDPNAVVVRPGGVFADVVLEPSGVHVPCRYGGAVGGEVSVLGPIRPGDQVLVVLPDGDLAMVPEIVRVLSGAHAPLPLEDDGKPVFRNDRLSVFARGVPVELRTGAGSNAVRLETDGTVRIKNDAVEVTVNPDGTIKLGGEAATDAIIKGTTYRTHEAALDNALANAFSALAAAGAAAASELGLGGALQSVAPLTALYLIALQSVAATTATALSEFEGAAGAYLSQASLTK